jgi:hypothetical protein
MNVKPIRAQRSLDGQKTEKTGGLNTNKQKTLKALPLNDSRIPFEDLPSDR